MSWLSYRELQSKRGFSIRKGAALGLRPLSTWLGGDCGRKDRKSSLRKGFDVSISKTVSVAVVLWGSGCRCEGRLIATKGD